jgi:PleD family two-component response regulator
LICQELELSALAAHLEVNGYTVMHESNAIDGLAVALEEGPDLVMVKIADSEIDGADLCRAMRDDPRGRSCYIVLIVEHEDENLFSKVHHIYKQTIFCLMPITRSFSAGKIARHFQYTTIAKRSNKGTQQLDDDCG